MASQTGASEMPTVFVPREITPGETRVAATPASVKLLTRQGWTVRVQSLAGHGANFDDDSYVAAGAELVPTDAVGSAWTESDVVVKVTSPTVDEVHAMGRWGLLVGFISPHANPESVRAMRDAEVDCLAMEFVPRISRAQSMDALSSQASIAGYKAVLLAASALDKYMPLLMTAAGTVKPAKVVVMGAGVAGLQAIATARRLGAIVEVSDIRDVVKEQVESLGGRFIELPDMGESGEGEGGYARQVTPEFLAKQREIVHRHVAACDAVITTALVPGRPAPKLVTEQMVKDMRAGGVIVDLAVAAGGNCELSELDAEVVKHGVRIIGHSNLPATMPRDASDLYSRNIVALLELLLKDCKVVLDRQDEIINGALLTHKGEIVHERTANALAAEGAA